MNNTILIFATIGLMACGNSKPKTVEEKIKAVCDCFEESKSDKSKRMQCFKLQDDLHKEITDSDEKLEFMEGSNICIDV